MLELYFSRGVYYEKMPNSKNFCATRPTRTFRPNLFRPRGKNQNSAPNILSASSSRFQKGMTRPPCIKNLGGDRFGRNPLFQGSGLTPRASGSKSPTRKLLARSFGDPENFMPIHGLGQKLWTFVAVTDRQTDRHTDRQTDTQTFLIDPCTTRGEKIFFLRICVGKPYTMQNFYLFTT